MVCRGSGKGDCWIDKGVVVAVHNDLKRMCEGNEGCLLIRHDAAKLQVFYSESYACGKREVSRGYTLCN